MDPKLSSAGHALRVLSGELHGHAPSRLRSHPAPPSMRWGLVWFPSGELSHATTRATATDRKRPEALTPPTGSDMLRPSEQIVQTERICVRHTLHFLSFRFC